MRSQKNVLEVILNNSRLNRFSTGLDFNLLDPELLDMAYDKVIAKQE